MPLVRISLMHGKANHFGKKVGEIVYQALVDAINVPVNNNFQIITEHNSNSLNYDPSYLNIQRSPGIIIIQITLNEDRSVELKKSLYHAIADRLHSGLGIRLEDVLINLVEVKKENWSYGNGGMQYA